MAQRAPRPAAAPSPSGARAPRGVGSASVVPAPGVGSASVGDPFEALGDPNRRAIVELLGSGDRSVQQLADALPISRPAVSRHLRLLKEAGLVVEEPRGTRRIYRLHDEGVEAVRTYLERVWGDGARRFQLVAENTSRPAADRGRAADPRQAADAGRAADRGRAADPGSTAPSGLDRIARRGPTS